MSTTSSTLFDSSVSSSSSGSQSSPKPLIGLGLGLPIDILHNKMDSTRPDLDLDSPASVTSSMPSTPTSPPLLPTRRSPPPRPAQTPGSEFAPMLTPSPSLRGTTTYATIDLAPLSTSFIPTTPLKRTSVGLGIFLDSPKFVTPTHARAGLGLDIPVLDAAELVTTFDNRPVAVTGLGIDLPCLTSTELVTTIHPTPLAFDVDSMFVDDGDDAALRAYSSCSSPSDDFVPWGASVAVPQRAVQRPVVVHHPSTAQSPTLGFDSSSFWGTYASAVKGDASLTPEVIYTTS